MFTCEYCGSVLKSISNLNQHKKTAKSCLLIQSKDKYIPESSNNFTCKYCEKEFTKKFNYELHLQSCKNKLSFLNEQSQLEIEELKNSILLLKQQIEKKDDIIKEKDFFLKEKENSLKEKNNSLKEKENSLKEKDKIINKLLKSNTQQKTISNTSNKNSNNTYISQNNYYNIDISQERFNQHIIDKYGFELYEKGGEGGCQLIIEFLSSSKNRYRAEIADNARNKIRLINIETDDVSFIDNNTLFGLCRKSEPLKKLLAEYGSKLLSKKENPDDIQSNTEKVVFRKSMFRIKENFNTEIFYPIKCYIQTNGIISKESYLSSPTGGNQISCSSSNSSLTTYTPNLQRPHPPPLLDDEKKEEISLKTHTANYIRDFIASNDDEKIDVNLDEEFDELYNYSSDDDDDYEESLP